MWGGWWKWWKCWLGHQSSGWEYIVTTGPCKYTGGPGGTRHHTLTPCDALQTLGLLLYTASLYLIILCMLSHLLILRCGDWLRESQIVFGPGSPAHWAMIGPGLPGPEYFWHRSGRVGSQHLLSELIIAQVWAHWPHIDSGNNIDNQPELWPAVRAGLGITHLVRIMLCWHSISQRNWFWLNARVSRKCVWLAFCDRGLLILLTKLHSVHTICAADSPGRSQVGFRGTWPDLRWLLIF